MGELANRRSRIGRREVCGCDGKDPQERASRGTKLSTNEIAFADKVLDLVVDLSVTASQIHNCFTLDRGVRFYR